MRALTTTPNFPPLPCLIYSAAMKCVVTAGPTCEPLDQVRRLTNFSTGRLGTELACFLQDRGHEVVLLIGEQATYVGPRRATEVRSFSSTVSLGEALGALARTDVGAVYHAAAVSDYRFGKVWVRTPDGQTKEVAGGKISTRSGTLLAELVPTQKIILELRAWFPEATLVGWKYEVDGERADVLRQAERQLAECRTDACVANGPAYGGGFGLVRKGSSRHLTGRGELYQALEELALGRLS